VSLLFPGVQTQDYQQSFLWLFIENIVIYSTEPKSKCFSMLSVSRNLCFILLRCLFFFRYKRGVIICNASHSQIYIPSLVSTKKVQLTGLGSLINNHSTGSPCEALEIPILFPFALFALPATQPTSAALEFSQVVPRPTRVSERSLDTITVALVFISDWLSITGQGTV
jgi:hypothetical protein